MESFLNGRQTVAKVIAGKGNENVPTQSLEQWTVPEPGSANPGDKNSGEAHIVAGGEGQPKVELVMVDGEVKKIQVTCSCGEVIHLECQYKGAGQIK